MNMNNMAKMAEVLASYDKADREEIFLDMAFQANCPQRTVPNTVEEFKEYCEEVIARIRAKNN